MVKMLATCLRKLGFGKVIISLVLVVVALQILHFSLLSQLENDTKLSVEMSRNKNVDTLMLQMLESLRNVYILDSSGSYHVVKYFVKSKPKNSVFLKGDVAIVTQSTANHLLNLEELSNRWRGPISVCVFTYDTDFIYAISAVTYFHICNPLIQEHVDFHIVYPINRPPNFEELKKLFDKKISCDISFQDLKIHNVHTDNYDISGIKYPHNLLRNVALKSTEADYIFLVDIDILPSLNLRKNFLRFMDKETKEPQLKVYVVPSFEVRSSQPIPKTKPELLSAVDTGQVRPFYWEVCWSCQKLTGYDTWENLPESGTLEAAYDVEWVHPWEPFYLAKKDQLPLYDERFKQYGYNRVSQICELHVVGYKFSVLNNAFVVHKGFKFVNKFHKSKTAEHKANRQLYKKLQEELKTRYPQSSRTCT